MLNYSSFINMAITTEFFSKLFKDPVNIIYIVVICMGIWGIFSWASKRLIKTSIIMLIIISVLSLTIFTSFFDSVPLYAQFMIIVVLGVLFFVIYEYESSND